MTKYEMLSIPPGNYDSLPTIVNEMIEKFKSSFPELYRRGSFPYVTTTKKEPIICFSKYEKSNSIFLKTNTEELIVNLVSDDLKHMSPKQV